MVPFVNHHKLLCSGSSYLTYPSQSKELPKNGVRSKLVIRDANEIVTIMKQRFMLICILVISGHLRGLLRSLEIRSSSAGKMMRVTASS